MFRSFLPTAAAVVLSCAASIASAATSVTLPAWVCAHADAVYADRFDADQTLVPHDASNGAGGAYPGKRTRTLHIAGLGSGTQNYYIYVPNDYTPTRSWPLLLVLHGTAPLGDSYAMTTRDNWVTAASNGRFIVAAPVADATGSSNGTAYESWLVPPTAGPSDYDLFDAIRADMEAAYNIERTRVYGWGFSSGAHVMHDLAINTYSEAWNAATMAAYGVSAGVLQGLACPGPSNAGCGPLLAALPRQIPVDIHVGNTDPNYPYAVADHTLFLAKGWQDGQTMHFTTFSGGHTYTVAQLSEIWTNLCPNAVTQ